MMPQLGLRRYRYWSGSGRSRGMVSSYGDSDGAGVLPGCGARTCCSSSSCCSTSSGCSSPSRAVPSSESVMTAQGCPTAEVRKPNAARLLAGGEVPRLLGLRGSWLRASVGVVFGRDRGGTDVCSVVWLSTGLAPGGCCRPRYRRRRGHQPPHRKGFRARLHNPRATCHAGRKPRPILGRPLAANAAPQISTIVSSKIEPSPSGVGLMTGPCAA
jgi:hypothetical protein